jgi:hypothetical protein
MEYVPPTMVRVSGGNDAGIGILAGVLWVIGIGIMWLWY